MMTRFMVLSLCMLALQSAHGSPDSFGRLSRVDGDVYVLKVDSDEWEYGTTNMLVEEGDVIKVGADDFAEIEFENGTLLWLDEVTRLRIRYLYRDYDGRDWLNGIDIHHGTVRADVPELARWDVCLDIETPTGSVTLGEESLAKVIVRRTGASKIIAYSGEVYVAGEWDELYLESGQAVWINSSGELERPYRIASFREDRFDRWCAEYRREYCHSTRYVHTDIYIGVHCLDTWGDWIWVIDYGWTWRPRVVRSWRPYSCGRWSWSARFGWFWVSHQPWGWIPFHYGRWAYSPVHGWVWIPGSTWGPGWVAWSHGPGWIAWTPLGVDDRPAVRGLEAYTAVSNESFASRSTSPPPERGYHKYADVTINQEKWDARQPTRSVVQKERREATEREVTRVVRDRVRPRDEIRRGTVASRTETERRSEPAVRQLDRKVRITGKPTREVRERVRARREQPRRRIEKRRPRPVRSESTEKSEPRTKPEIRKTSPPAEKETGTVPRKTERSRDVRKPEKVENPRSEGRGTRGVRNRSRQ